jgi:CubicO group peptidase (beta-lactamase class C family)
VITTAHSSRRTDLFHHAAGAFVLLWSLLLSSPAVAVEASFDNFIQQTMAEGAIPGMALAIVKDSKVSLAKGYGVTDGGSPFTANTPILIASLSKAMTAAVALVLVAEGRIDLDAPVQLYLPEFRIKTPDRGASITVRYLLNQTSGLSDPGFPEMRMTQPSSLAERVASLQSAVPEDAPGTAFHYFNSNYALVARIVEVVSGKPFEAVLADQLFKPLGMTGTYAVPTFASAKAQKTPPATGHVLAYGQAWRWREPGGFLGGHGGVISTAADMGRWLQWQMTGQPNILPPELLTLMQSPPAGSSYAMGWFRQTTNGETKIWHDGVFSTIYADIVIKPERGLGIVLLYGLGGALPAARTFPNMRAGALAIASGKTPEPAGLSTVTIGRWSAAATLILAVAALMDLRGWRRAGTALTWRAAAGLAARFVPIFLLLSLPWLLQFASGRAFSFEAIFFAMLDLAAGLAFVGTILASSAFCRLALIARNGRRPRLADGGGRK